MKIQHKILACAETGEDYLAVIAWGRADLDVMREVFLSVAEITKSMGACRVLIDLRQGDYDVTYHEIYQLLDEVKPGVRLLNNRIALLSAPAIEQYDQIFMLSVYLLNLGVETDAFCQANRAIQWLEQKRQRPVYH